MSDKIRIGVIGGGRGESLLYGAQAAGMEVVAICEQYEPLAERLVRRLAAAGVKVEVYRDFDRMLEHELDAVVLANYATEHCDFAIRALRAGKHVLSECMAVSTLAEAVRLAEAVEASDRVYMLAENYPFSANNLEMKRLFREGLIGDFIYGEGEYVHPINPDEFAPLATGLDHWRTWIPVTYYCTHSMGPVMQITGTRPVAVNGFVVPRNDNDPWHGEDITRCDDTSVLMCTMDNGAVAKIVPWSKMRDHGNRVRICGNKGTLEHNQGEGLLRIALANPGAGQSGYTLTSPPFPAEMVEAAKHGHGGGDFGTNYFFAKAIREGSAPVIDVYQALDMTLIGILGYRSALNGNVRLEVPDFRNKALRDQYRNDDWTPDPAKRRPGMPFSSVRGEVVISEEALADHRRRRDKYEATLKD